MKSATGDAWLGYAFAYGGLGQLLAGMWEFRNRKRVRGHRVLHLRRVLESGWGYGPCWWPPMPPPHRGTTMTSPGSCLAFAIFNTYMLLGARR